jgi:hypothetical protein
MTMARIKPLFSHRHRAALFETKTLKPSFFNALRVGIEQILARYSDSSNFENWTYDQASEMLCTLHGWDQLYVREGQSRRNASFREFIVKGFPSDTLDAIEAWFACEPQAADAAARDLNALLAIHNSQWRFIAGEAVFIDSGYLHDEVIAKTADLLRTAKAPGPLQEFQAALSALQSGESKRAVVEAHKSVESVMKLVLGTDEHLTFGRLLADVIKSGLLPDFYEEFLRHFEMLALGAVKARNRPGTGHGQGADSVDVPRSLAQFAIHLAGSINVFLLEHWIERQGLQSAAAQADTPTEDDVPF